MRGTGDILSDPIELPVLPAVLVNPGLMVATKDVFAAFGLITAARSDRTCCSALEEDFRQVYPLQPLFGRLAQCCNDLERPAIKLQPAIANILAELRRQPNCRLARMSGSGPTCFALFDSSRMSTAVARSLRAGHPDWWVRATVLADPRAPAAGPCV